VAKRPARITGESTAPKRRFASKNLRRLATSSRG
jgi:hypothetical protein